MRAAFVHSVRGRTGTRRVSLEEAAAAGRLRSEPEALRRAGFTGHRLAEREESWEDLVASALGPLALAHPDAGALLLASTLAPASPPGAREARDHVDLAGARLLSRLNLARAFVASVGQQACTGSVGALRLASALAAAEPGLCPILVAAGDRLPGDGLLLEQGYCALSDGAAAAVVGTEPRGHRLVGFHAVVHGEVQGASDEESMGRFFPVAHALAREVLAQAGREAKDVARLLPPNLPAAAARVLARSLGIDERRAASPTLEEAGHAMSCDPLLSLAAIEREPSRPGDLVLLLSAGYGLTWQAALLERMPA